jgi:transcription elongation factor GreA
MTTATTDSGTDAPPAAAADAEDGGDVLLTPAGHATLLAEYEALVTDRRPRAAARLAEASQEAADAADTAEYTDACAELDLIEERIALLGERLRNARVLERDDSPPEIVKLGTRVVVEDLDEGGSEGYVLVSSAEANAIEGRLSSESPVGRAISGHRKGDVVEAHAPHRIRHLRIVNLGRP